MKNRGVYIIVICFLFACIIIMSGLIISERDPWGWWRARWEADKIISVCKDLRIYNKRYPYTEICYHVRRLADEFELDRKLVYAIIIQESQFNPKAKNRNGNNTEDRGLCQINSIWNSVALSDAVLSAMFGGRTNKRMRVEDFIYEIEHNIFMGCYILRHKLTNNKTLRAGITRYNGAGYWAEQYADAVIDIYHDIAKLY